MDAAPPTADEAYAYAKNLGMRGELTQPLFRVACAGLLAPLPAGWVAIECASGVYYSEGGGATTWSHPHDGHYAALIAAEEEEAAARRRTASAAQTPSPPKRLGELDYGGSLSPEQGHEVLHSGENPWNRARAGAELDSQRRLGSAICHIEQRAELAGRLAVGGNEAQAARDRASGDALPHDPDPLERGALEPQQAAARRPASARAAAFPSHPRPIGMFAASGGAHSAADMRRRTGESATDISRFSVVDKGSGRGFGRSGLVDDEGGAIDRREARAPDLHFQGGSGSHRYL